LLLGKVRWWALRHWHIVESRHSLTTLTHNTLPIQILSRQTWNKPLFVHVAMPHFS